MSELESKAAPKPPFAGKRCAPAFMFMADEGPLHRNLGVEHLRLARSAGS